MNEALRSTRHARYWCGYHFVRTPRYRKDILVGVVTEYTRPILISRARQAIEWLYSIGVSEPMEAGRRRLLALAGAPALQGGREGQSASCK